MKIKVMCSPADLNGMYLWWLPYLAAPAMLVATFAMLVVALLFLRWCKKKRGKPVQKGEDRPPPRSWYTLREWAPVVGVVFTVVAVMLTSMLLARRALDDTQTKTIARMNQIYSSVQTTIQITNEKIEANADLIEDVRNNILLLQGTTNTIATELQQISDRVSYVEGFVDGMD